MAGETWSTPIAVPVGSAIPTTYFENVRKNISVLGRGGGKSTIAEATEASSLTLPNETDQLFRVVTSSSGGVDYISTAGREYGNKITLVTSGSGLTFNHNESSAPVGYAKLFIMLHGTGNYDITAYDKSEYTFVLYNDGTEDMWLCTI